MSIQVKLIIVPMCFGGLEFTHCRFFHVVNMTQSRIVESWYGSRADIHKIDYYFIPLTNLICTVGWVMWLIWVYMTCWDDDSNDDGQRLCVHWNIRSGIMMNKHSLMTPFIWKVCKLDGVICCQWNMVKFKGYFIGFIVSTHQIFYLSAHRFCTSNIVSQCTSVLHIKYCISVHIVFRHQI